MKPRREIVIKDLFLKQVERQKGRFMMQNNLSRSGWLSFTIHGIAVTRVLALQLVQNVLI